MHQCHMVSSWVAQHDPAVHMMLLSVMTILIGPNMAKMDDELIQTPTVTDPGINLGGLYSPSSSSSICVPHLSSSNL
jgi:hypothetical protein